MTEPIKPALTAEEWKEALDSYGGDITVPPYPPDEKVEFYNSPRRLAALCLYRQPFGFTREMLLALKMLLAHHIAEDRGRDGDTWYSDELEKLVALGQDAVDRIESLLPPEKQ
jgi:hypothetical protein